MASSPSLAPTVELERRAWKAKLITCGLLGLFLGAALGALIFGSLGTESTATAYIRINPPVDLGAVAGGADQTTPVPQDMTENYVSGEVNYLSGEGFAQTLGRKLALSEPASIVVAQAGGSTIVTISNNSPSADEARRTVQTAIDIYGQQLAQRVDQQMQTILPALDQWQLANAADPERLAQIGALRDAVLLQAEQGRIVTVLQPPTVNDPTLSRWLIGVLLGSVLGAALGVLAAMRHSRRVGQPQLVPQIAAAADRVLSPAVNIRTPWSTQRSSLARTLYAQCLSAEPNEVIVVLGVTAGSGTSVVTTMLEFAATEDGPGAHEDSADQRRTQIIDAGTLGDSASAHHAVHQASPIVLVVRIDHDTPAQALTTCAAASAVAAPVLVLFTYRPWWDSLLNHLKPAWPPARRVHGGRPDPAAGSP